MKLTTKNCAAVLMCSVAFGLVAAPAQARAHKARHHRHHFMPRTAFMPDAPPQQGMVPAFAARGGLGDTYAARANLAATAQASTSGEAIRGSRRMRRSHTGDAFGGATSNALVSEARAYLGTNPTGRGRQWCGAFMDLVLKKTGHAGGGNLARAYARYGTRVSGPQVGAIAVMNHHVGVVSGLDANGNPIIVSGNHNRTVAESVYPRSRIAAYVVPN